MKRIYVVNTEERHGVAGSLAGAKKLARILLCPVNGAGTILPGPKRLYWKQVEHGLWLGRIHQRGPDVVTIYVAAR